MQVSQIRTLFAQYIFSGVFAAAVLFTASPAHSAIIISEVNANGSSAPYAADWFELTNTGASAVNISGWKMDDNSDASASAVGLRGVTSIAAGQSVVFVESNTSGSNDASIEAAFIQFWFGLGGAPAGFVIGAYGGSGVGLSSTTDHVNIFDSSNARVTGVAFNASTTGFTFDNAAGIGSTTTPLPTISTLSAIGVNGAFASAGSPTEVGSPGTIVPEPSSVALLLCGLVGAALYGWRRR